MYQRAVRCVQLQMILVGLVNDIICVPLFLYGDYGLKGLNGAMASLIAFLRQLALTKWGHLRTSAYNDAALHITSIKIILQTLFITLDMKYKNHCSSSIMLKGSEVTLLYIVLHSSLYESSFKILDLTPAHPPSPIMGLVRT